MVDDSRTVKNNVINALLEAMYDVLDSDGRLSIIRYANLEHLKNRLPSDGDSPFEDFLKLLSSMNFLLAYSPKVMYELGRKFAFYFSPFGSHIMEFVDLLVDSLYQEIQFDVNYPKENEIEICLTSCPFCRGMSALNSHPQTVEYNCDFFSGVIYEALRKSAENDYIIEVNHSHKTTKGCIFKVNLLPKHQTNNQTIEGSNPN